MCPKRKDYGNITISYFSEFGFRFYRQLMPPGAFERSISLYEKPGSISNDLESNLGVEIRRDAKITLYPFTDYFRGFENVGGIIALFGEKTREILNNLKVEFYSSKFGYMGVSDKDGHIMISSYHLKTADYAVVYLDVYHELHHVKQFYDGKQIYLPEYEYVDSPVEIEAYLATVKEARRIGLSEEQIRDYLKIEWIDEDQFKRLLKRMGVLQRQEGSNQ